MGVEGAANVNVIQMLLDVHDAEPKIRNQKNNDMQPSSEFLVEATITTIKEPRCLSPKGGSVFAPAEVWDSLSKSSVFQTQLLCWSHAVKEGASQLPERVDEEHCVGIQGCRTNDHRGGPQAEAATTFVKNLERNHPVSCGYEPPSSVKVESVGACQAVLHCGDSWLEIDALSGFFIPDWRSGVLRGIPATGTEIAEMILQFPFLLGPKLAQATSAPNWISPQT